MELLFALLLAVLPPCPTEDVTGTICAWDASTSGNGQGISFLVLGDFYIPEYHIEGNN